MTKTGTDLVKRGPDTLGVDLFFALEKEGNADEVGLTLKNMDMTYEAWESLGRFLGDISRRVRWYIGDWLNFGEELFGQESAQGVESTTAERYSEVERVTGLSHGTLMNIASVCRNVPKRNRRPELGVSLHAAVSKINVDEQAQWLQQAIDNGWSREELRDAVKAAKLDTDGGEGEDAVSEPRLSLAERIEAAARVVYAQASNNRAGDFVVPASAMAQLREALGEE